LGDVQFHLISYIYGGVCVLAQALYLLYIQKMGIEKHISAVGFLYINSVTCIPLLIIYTVVTSEILAVMAYPQWTEPGFVASYLIVISMGCVLNYSLFLCTTLNSALTTSLVGVVKGVVTTVIGMFTFGGVEPTVLNISGICMNTTGGIWYSAIKYQEKKKKLSALSSNEEDSRNAV
ncbi:uncharacterized protein LOC102810125, partial [Saccoglossus kowalevskii]|uniref:Solute carrier family 35 member D3-like n=1 Tax=Saccoglossus kowalevskii TaxID=10224 RepID=A0ABM0M312_SACKO